MARKRYNPDVAALVVAGAPERVGARDVEIAQGHMAQPMGGAGIA
jgi:hypothetical protein